MIRVLLNRSLISAERRSQTVIFISNKLLILVYIDFSDYQRCSRLFSKTQNEAELLPVTCVEETWPSAAADWLPDGVRLILTSNDDQEKRRKSSDPVSDDDSPIKPKRRRISAASPLRDCSSAASPLRDCSSAASPLRDCSSAASPLRDCSSAAAPLRDCSSAAAPLSHHASPPAPGSHRHSSCFHLSLLKSILMNQEVLMDQIKIIYKSIQGLQTPSGDELLLKSFPLNSQQSVEDMEAQLHDNPELHNQLSAALALQGGGSLNECVGRIMAALLTHSLSQQMNWRGVNGKIGFQRLHMKKLVTMAVRRNRLTATATDREIEARITKWLQNAADRNGGRDERRKSRKRRKSRNV
ncbi:uncharacterized protein LOC129376524 [Poeciliopsis prolifica]|uniref:uncharacterized protein LOC129376524 n=1 Tax=Poeciliopsis prolifica TaxID=188132 RepID=UPI002413E80D|nr:uncharacterized protein LOC129376524 [Poeciliopsis prolifica]